MVSAPDPPPLAPTAGPLSAPPKKEFRVAAAALAESLPLGLLLQHIVLLLADCGGCDCCGFGDAETTPAPVISERRARGADPC